MNGFLLAGVTAMTIVLASQAFAQGVSVEIAPEQRTRIKEYVVKEKVPRVTVKERYRVGTTVPAEVELREVPADWVRQSAIIVTTIPTMASTSLTRPVVA